MKTKIRIWSLLMAVSLGGFFNSALAYEDGTGANVSGTNSNQLGQSILYAPSTIQKDNVSVGSLPSAFGTSANLMDYRPGFLPNEAVEAPLENLVKFGPKVITRQMLETARRRLVDRDGKQVYQEEVWENMIVRDGIYFERFPADFPNQNLANKVLPKSDSVRQIMLNQIPPNVVEGVDYIWLGPVFAISKSKDELIFIHNLRDGVVQRVIDCGGNGIIFENQGADRDIKSGSLAANFWTSLAQIVSQANPWGMGISPGISYQGGTTSQITKPFVAGIGIYVLNWNKFLNKPVAVVASNPAADEFAQVRKAVEETEKLISDCKTPCLNNLTLRTKQGKNYLSASFLNRDAGNEQGYLEALKIADFNFEKAEENYAVVRNNKKDDQVIAKQIYDDSAYWRAGIIKVLRGDDEAKKYAQARGVTVPNFK